MRFRPVIVNEIGKVTDKYKESFATEDEARKSSLPMVRLLDQWRHDVGHGLTVRIQEEDGEEGT